MVSSSALWKISAILYGVAVPAHIAGGLQLQHPLLNKIPITNKADRIGQRSLQNCYNYVNVSCAIAALLSLQWGKMAGPQTFEEKTIFWLLQMAHVVYGYRYLQVGDRVVILVFWTAPALHLIAYMLK